MNLADVMDGLAAALDTIPKLRPYPYWATRVTAPAAVVGWPDPLTYDDTMARGMDSLELPVIVLVGAVDARSSRDALAAYAQGAGPSSVKAAIDEHTTTAWDTARVMRAEFGVITVAGVEYLAGTFHVHLTGKGAT
jgi:hypothetical protein